VNQRVSVVTSRSCRKERSAAIPAAYAQGPDSDMARPKSLPEGNHSRQARWGRPRWTRYRWTGVESIEGNYMITKTGRLAVALATSLALVTACASSDGDSTAGEESDNVVQIGAVFGLQGDYADFGKSGLAGVEMAIDDINENGFVVDGKTYKFELKSEDDRSDAGVAASAATGLVTDDGIKFLMGPTTSVEAPPVAQITMPRKVIQFSPANGVQQFLQEDNTSGNGLYLFHTLIDAATQGAFLWAGIEEHLPEVKRIGVLYQNDASNIANKDALLNSPAAADYEIVDEVGFDPTTTDFSALLTGLKSKDLDMIYFAASGSSPVLIVKQASQLDAAPVFATTNQSPQIAMSDALGGKPIPQQFFTQYNSRNAVEPTSEETAAFFENLKGYLGGELNVLANTSLWYYDYLFMLTEAMAEAGTVDDTTAIAEALAGLEYDGVLGDGIHFNERHDAIHGVDQGLVTDGEFEAFDVAVTEAQ
jgi:branched-chain amino acid transport system substrate-binding protein